MRSVHCLLVLFCLSLTGCFGEPTDTTLDQEPQAQAGAPAVELAGWVTDAADLLNDTQWEARSPIGHLGNGHYAENR